MTTALDRTRRAGTVITAVLTVAMIGTISACGEKQTAEAPRSPLADELVGTWFAYRNNVIENMWTFRRDGTCVNDGWPSGNGGSASPSLPYHLEGTYHVSHDSITVVFTPQAAVRDTVFLSDPDITMNRLVYSTGTTPVAFLRERAAIGQQATAPASTEAANDSIRQDLVGNWVALSNGFPANTWQFNDDGTFVNEGWSRLDKRTLIVKRLYQVSGHYTVSGRRVILTNEKILQFDPETNRVNNEMTVDERIVLYDTVISKGRLVYTNEVGLPVAYRSGVVTPTNW